MNQNLQNKSNSCLQKQVTKVRLHWQHSNKRYSDGKILGWNEICAWCIEHYGLPGDKFEWHGRTECMEFDFYDEKDAIHFSLRWL